jgi:hypothetical protein
MKKMIIAALFIAVTASASDFTSLSFPVGINVEGTYVPSSMYVKIKVKEYNTPLDSFALGQLDPREATFVALMNALRDKNYIRAEGLLEIGTTSKAVEQARARVEQKPRSIRQTVDLYNAAFNGLRDVTVVAQVLAGSKSLFIWEVGTGTPKAMCRAFSVGLSGQKLTASEVTMQTPVDLLIVNNIMTPKVKDPALYKGIAALKKRFEFSLPDDIVLQFDGQPLDFDVFDENTPPSNEVTRLYRSAYHAFRLNAMDDYLNAFTPASREKLQKWLASMTAEERESYYKAVTAGRRLRLVINAEPVMLAFYTSPVQQTPHGTMAYDYIVRQPDGKLAFANVAYESFLDDVLQNPALFDVTALTKQQ